ncbi:maker547 [Drosophila busckii]|uniref:Maker547 n=1 Tax=Drosophila busckii TaxID=30019 RepID=A0A0M4ERN0_DROBS|nr:maker547 [Drosophila busckii]
MNILYAVIFLLLKIQLNTNCAFAKNATERTAYETKIYLLNNDEATSKCEQPKFEFEKLQAKIREQELTIARLEAKCFAVPTEATSCLPFGKSNEIQRIRIPGTESFQVLCAAKIAGEGWTVILNKRQHTGSFYRTWYEYRNGFGDLQDDFFIGLQRLHLMTKFQPHELYVEIKDFWNTTSYASYSNFSIGNETEAYKLLTLGAFTGGKDYFKTQLHMKFSTLNRDNDNDVRNCATIFQFGWWYNTCRVGRDSVANIFTNFVQLLIRPI